LTLLLNFNLLLAHTSLHPIILIINIKCWTIKIWRFIKEKRIDLHKLDLKKSYNT
jgi:hypothetical protein